MSNRKFMARRGRTVKLVSGEVVAHGRLIEPDELPAETQASQVVAVYVNDPAAVDDVDLTFGADEDEPEPEMDFED